MNQQPVWASRRYGMFIITYSRIMIRSYFIAMVAGIAGTALMTLFVYLLAFIAKKTVCRNKNTRHPLPV
jgi:hypothetical protein